MLEYLRCEVGKFGEADIDGIKHSQMGAWCRMWQPEAQVVVVDKILSIVC